MLQGLQMSAKAFCLLLPPSCFLYSDKGIELTNWGVEGESFEIVYGIKQFLPDSGGYYGFRYVSSGLGVLGLCGYFDCDTYYASQEQNVVEAINLFSRYNNETGKGYRLTYTENEQRIFDTYFQRTYDICLARFQEFIEGRKDPAYDWDAFVDEINYMVPDEMITIHNAALERYLQKHPELR